MPGSCVRVCDNVLDYGQWEFYDPQSCLSPFRPKWLPAPAQFFARSALECPIFGCWFGGVLTSVDFPNSTIIYPVKVVRICCGGKTEGAIFLVLTGDCWISISISVGRDNCIAPRSPNTRVTRSLSFFDSPKIIIPSRLTFVPATSWRIWRSRDERKEGESPQASPQNCWPLRTC